MKGARANGRELFTPARSVHAGAWSEGSRKAPCVRCGHSMDGHGGRGLGRCQRPGCACSAFALWKGVPVEYALRRFERELRRHGEAGERALALWAKRRPSCVAGVEDAAVSVRKALAADLVRVAGKVDPASVVALALVASWDDLEGVPRMRLEWVPMRDHGCVAAEAFRGLWSDGGSGGPPCSCEEDHGTR